MQQVMNVFACLEILFSFPWSAFVLPQQHRFFLILNTNSPSFTFPLNALEFMSSIFFHEKYFAYFSYLLGATFWWLFINSFHFLLFPNTSWLLPLIANPTATSQDDWLGKRKMNWNQKLWDRVEGVALRKSGAAVQSDMGLPWGEIGL